MSDYRQITLSNPQEEYAKLCQILFSTQPSTCNSFTTDARKSIKPSKDGGLFPYMQGLINNASGFSYAEAEQKFGSQLKQLKGASLYLSGTGQCKMGDDARCFTMNKGSTETTFDFIDDIYNLVGAFEFLRKDFSDGASPSTCFIAAETFGSKEGPFCHMFYSHNLFATPYTWAIRSVDPKAPSIRSSCQ